MSEGMVAVQSRIAQIQALIGVRPPASSSTSSASSNAFASALDDASASGTSTGTSGGTSTGNNGEAAVTIASKYLGVPYKWGGTDPDTGLDCSGLTQLVYHQLGVDLPRTSSAQSATGTRVDSLADAKPGDLVFFGSPVHHVGIYVGDGKMLNAPHSGAKVRIEKLWATPTAIRRVLPSETSSAVQGVSAAGVSLSGSASGLSGTPYASLFAAAGAKYGVDPSLLSAVAKAESGYRPNAVSSAGARGMMQLMPGTARELGVDPDVPAQAVDGAAKLLANHMRSFNGRTDLALAAYNAGAGAVRKYGGIPPYGETQNYVRKVTGYWGDLR